MLRRLNHWRKRSISKPQARDSLFLLIIYFKYLIAIEQLISILLLNKSLNLRITKEELNLYLILGYPRLRFKIILPSLG